MSSRRRMSSKMTRHTPRSRRSTRARGQEEGGAWTVRER